MRLVKADQVLQTRVESAFSEEREGWPWIQAHKPCAQHAVCVLITVLAVVDWAGAVSSQQPAALRGRR